ncbi:MAG TPA: MMPL family transporter [Candidatus Ornithoclostridium faecavium]|nr:MMPL family transporter [Candidatus Ornithoclostridium faecavium]
MKRFAKFVVKYRLIILGVMLLLMIASLFAMSYVNVNSDILSYLPEDVDMTRGLNFMKDNFDMQGDAIIGVQGATYEDMQELVSLIENKGGTKQGGIIWYGLLKEMQDIDWTIMENPWVASLVNNLLNKYGLKLEDLKEMTEQLSNNPEIVSLFHPDDETYLMMLQLNVPSSSNEAMDLLSEIENYFDEKGLDYAMGGSTQITREIFDSTIGEIGKYALVAVLVMFIILLLTTNSIIDPIVFMVTLGVSIVVNMGTNLILPSVSVVTYAASSILQLALSMDYAIFLMHSFAEEQKKTLDDKLAMERAIPKTFSTISASALTTVGGFLALFAMRFKIGEDLGLVLAKGVFLSLVTVVLLQPCLMLLTNKIARKTQHRIIVPKFKNVASYAVTHRKTIVTIALLLLIPTVIMQNMVELSYIKFVEEEPNPTAIEQKVDALSNSLVVIVPAKTESMDGESNIKDQYEFLEKIRERDDVNAVMGLFSMLPEDIAEGIVNLVNDEDMGKLMASSGMDMSMITGFLNNGYTMYSVMINAESESAEGTKALNEIRAILDDTFGAGEYYITGMTQAVSDLQDITPTDFMVVSLVSVAIIFVILLFTLKSLKMSTIVVLVIEFGIFVNLSISYIFGQTVNFMAYIILSSIQLGATVDYAILYTVKYQNYLGIRSAREAAYTALTESGVSIMTSVAILAGCCLSVSLITTNIIVSEITLMIARGSIISGILVMVLLPALLIISTGNQKLEKRSIRRLQNKSMKKVYKEGNLSDTQQTK